MNWLRKAGAIGGFLVFCLTVSLVVPLVVHSGVWAQNSTASQITAQSITSATGTFSGAVTVGTLNGLTFNSGTGTLAIANSKTFTVNNTLTLAGTDGTTMTFPTTSATLARTDAGNTFTGHQTLEGVTTTGAQGTGALVFATSPTLTTPTLGVATATTVNGVTIPSATDTTALLGTVQTFTAGQTINAAAGLSMGNQTTGTGTALNHAAITLTTANVTGMNGAPVTLLTGTANKTLVICGPVLMRYTKVTTDFANGGAIVIQYHTGTKAATGTLAAAQLQSGSTENVIVPTAQTSMTLGDNLEITNATGAFTAGGTSTLLVSFDYYLQ